MRVAYNCKCLEGCKQYYKNQAGNGLPYFAGSYRQKGFGFFSNILRLAVPLIQSGLLEVGKYLGKKALHTGNNILDDITSGNPIKQSFRKRTLETKDNIEKSIMEKIRKIQTGKGKRLNKKKIIKRKKQKQNKKINNQKKNKVKKTIKKTKPKFGKIDKLQLKKTTKANLLRDIWS